MWEILWTISNSGVNLWEGGQSVLKIKKLSKKKKSQIYGINILYKNFSDCYWGGGDIPHPPVRPPLLMSELILCYSSCSRNCLDYIIRFTLNLKLT